MISSIAFVEKRSRFAQACFFRASDAYNRAPVEELLPQSARLVHNVIRCIIKVISLFAETKEDLRSNKTTYICAR
jgi:hypothetical protein